MKALVHVQARSVRSISILHNWDYSYKNTLAKLIQHKLQNVTNLVYFFELDTGIVARDFVYDVGFTRGIASCVQRFKLPKLESAIVAVSIPASCQDRQPAPSGSKAKMSVFEEQAERQLVASEEGREKVQEK